MSERLRVDPIGGQAVIEGVMMRGPHGVGVAVRRPDGQIQLKQEVLASLRQRYPVLKLPFVRGVAALVESLSLGMRMLEYSAAVASGELPFTAPSEGSGAASAQAPAAEKRHEPFGWLMIAVMVVGLIAVFKVLPAYLSGLALPYLPGPLARSALEGAVRIGLFIGYLLAISLMQDVKALYQYHGAEHQVINCVEAGQELTAANAVRFSPIHPRCGTSFLLITLLLQILVFALIPNQFKVLERVALQLALLLPLAGVSFELIRLAGRATTAGARASIGARLALWVTLPGQWLQRLTTRPASEAQIEVAIASLNAALAIAPAPEPAVP